MSHPFMEAAARLAFEGMAQHAGGPFGAVVVRGGEIIGSGHNRVLLDCDPSAHAEVVAIRDACKALGQFHLTGCDLYTTCEPCPMCLAAAYWAHIRCIYYANTRQDAADIGFDDKAIYQQLALPMQDRSIAFVRIDCPTATDTMQQWHEASDKTPY